MIAVPGLKRQPQVNLKEILETWAEGGDSLLFKTAEWWEELLKKECGSSCEIAVKEAECFDQRTEGERTVACRIEYFVKAYQRCEKEGIGISVMKPFSGGQLLDAAQSPFGRALSPYQCIRYCLDSKIIFSFSPK